MDKIQQSQIVAFMKRYRFRGGRLRRFRVQTQSAQRSSGEIVVSVRETESDKRLRLRLVLENVEEYRFQRRPGTGIVRLKEVRLGYFNGSFFLNFDAFPEDGPPSLIDFRASDAFIAAQTISWEIVPSKAKPKS